MGLSARVLRYGIGIALALSGSTRVFAGVTTLGTGSLRPAVNAWLMIAGAALIVGIAPRVFAALIGVTAVIGLGYDMHLGTDFRVESVRDFLIILGCSTLFLVEMKRPASALLLLRWGTGGSLALLFGAQKIGWLIHSLKAGAPWGFAVFISTLGFPLPSYGAAFALLNETVSAALVAFGFAFRMAAALAAVDMAVSFAVSLRLHEEALRGGLYMLFFTVIALSGHSSFRRRPSEHALRSHSEPVATLTDTGAKLVRYCLGCHNPASQGRIAPALIGVGKRYTRQQLVDIVTNGRNAMPSFGDRWSGAQIRAVVDYLRKN